MKPWLRVRLVADRVVAVFAGILVAPLVAVLAVLIRRDDGGPVFVRVERMGRDFEPFNMWKLRSMRAERPDGRAEGAALTAEHDDRVTRVGGMLRSYHLDEIPQLLNVAKGEMLLLGPRPETPEYVDREDPGWQKLMQVPPGIAGPTQLVVRDWERRLVADSPGDGTYEAVVLPVKLAIDGWYLDGCSPLRDFEVGLALVERFLPGSRATRMRKRLGRELPRYVAVVTATPDMA